jgi:hypothetical protein
MRIRSKVVTQSGRILRPAGAVFDIDDETAGKMIADGRAEPAESAVLPVAPGAPAPRSGSSPLAPKQGDLGEGTDTERELEARKAEYRRQAKEAGFEEDEIDEAVRQRLEYDDLLAGGMPEADAREEMTKRYPDVEDEGDDAAAAARAIADEAEFYKELNAGDAIEWIGGLDAEALERIAALENGREQPRVTVTRAIDARREQLASGASES